MLARMVFHRCCSPEARVSCFGSDLQRICPEATSKEAGLRHAGAPGRLCLGLFCLPFYTCFSFQLYRHPWDRTNIPIKENNMVTLKMGPLPPGQPGRSSVPEALGSGRAPSERAAGPAWCHLQNHMPLFTEVGPSCRWHLWLSRPPAPA